MLFQQEWQQHQQAAVVNHPPDVDVAADFRGGVGEEVDSFRHEQSHASCADGADSLQERLPRPLVFVLPPSVRPPENHRVGLQPAETSRLNAVDLQKAAERERAERKRFFLVKTGLINVSYLLADFEGTELPRAGGRTQWVAKLLACGSYMCDNPSATFFVTRTSTNPLTRSSSMCLRRFAFAVAAAWWRLTKSPGTTAMHTVRPLPAFSCETNANSFRYFGIRSSLSLHRTSNCGRQFLVCGWPG